MNNEKEKLKNAFNHFQQAKQDEIRERQEKHNRILKQLRRVGVVVVWFAVLALSWAYLGTVGMIDYCMCCLGFWLYRNVHSRTGRNIVYLIFLFFGTRLIYSIVLIVLALFHVHLESLAMLEGLAGTIFLIILIVGVWKDTGFGSVIFLLGLIALIGFLHYGGCF